MIFRWSIWGEHVAKNIELLRYSLLSFQKQFGDKHQYIVYTDDANFVSKRLDAHIDVKAFPTDQTSQFCVASLATWRKWCPSPRLDIDQIEIFIDSDVFLLQYPAELEALLSDPKVKFAILGEYHGESFQRGAMHKKADPKTPFINAGFFVQKAGQDITSALTKEFEWWKKNVKTNEQTHHDEQGALAVALTKYFINNELFIFPKDKYMIISERSNTGVTKLDNATLFHATYPNHPAFYKFKHVLDEVISK